LQERDQPGLAAIVEPQFHFEIGAKLQIADRLGCLVQQVEEGVEVLGCGVVRARRADDIQRLQTQFSLERAQDIGLAGDADHRQTPVARRARRFQKRKRRRPTHPHAARKGHVGGVGDDGRQGFPAVGGVRQHGKHGIDKAMLQQAGGERGGDAGPLCAGNCRGQTRAQHSVGHAEKRLVRIGVGGAAMYAPFQRRIVRGDELAGPTASLAIAQPRHAAIGAQPVTPGTGKGGNLRAGAGLVEHAVSCGGPHSRYVRKK
jgi:hypothetical protein